MTAILNISVQGRANTGKANCRRMRRLQNMVPGVVYGGKQANTNVMLEHNVLQKYMENPGFFVGLINLDIDGDKQQTILKDLHRHPYKKQVLHFDMLRVTPTDYITMTVPLSFINEAVAPGVKQGGVVHHLLASVEVYCQAQHLPEVIEVDLINLQIDQSIHFSEISLPENVNLVAMMYDKQQDMPVISITKPKGGAEEADA